MSLNSYTINIITTTTAGVTLPAADYSVIVHCLLSGLPEVSIPPVSATVGSTAVMECQVRSIPAATSITWAHQQDSISRPIISAGRFITSGQNLTILNTQEADTGYYICSAQNTFGSNSTSGRLTVRSKNTYY